MSNELKTTNTAVVSGTSLSRIISQYDESYAAKPAPQSMELIADNRHKIATLHQITQHEQLSFTVSLVAKCINEILKKFIHVKRGMDAGMVGGTSELICGFFPQMTPADVKLFMTKGVMSEYGPILDRVDGALILSWASQYWDQMKRLIKLRQRNEEKDDPKVPVPEAIEKLSEQLRVKETVKRTQEVLKAEKRKSLADEYAERGWDLDEEMKDRR